MSGKVIRIDVTKTVGTQISVIIPDGFDENRLMQWSYNDAIREAVDKLDPDFDPFEYGIEVESVEHVDDPEKEQKDYCVYDLRDAIARAEQAHAAKKAKEAK